MKALVAYVFILFPFVFLCQNNIAFIKQLNETDTIKNDSVAFQLLEFIADKQKLSVKLQLELNYRIITRANFLQKYNKATALGIQSLALAQKNNLDSMEAVFNKVLGITNYYMYRKRAALPYFEKAVAIAHKNNFWEMEALCYNNLGGALTDLQEFVLAEQSLLKSIAIMKSHGKDNNSNKLRTYRVLARFYSEQGKYDKAEPLYLTLIEKSKINKDSISYYDNLLFYSEILSNRGEVNKALAMSSQAVAYERKMKNFNQLLAALTIHSGNLSNAGKNKEAYLLITESNYLMRTIFANNLAKEISEVEVKYKTEQIKQEKNIAEIKAKKQSQIYLFSFFGILIVMVSGAFIWNVKRNAKQKTMRLAELTDIEKTRFKEVIEAEEKERSRIAQELHDGLGQLLSTARLNVACLEDALANEDKPDLERSLKIIDDACVEVRSISHNLMPNALIRLGLIPAIIEVVNNINSAKGIKIDFTTNIQESLGKSLDITIYRVVQEILNNMIRHAKANRITMAINQNADDLEISMTDNGIGFNTNELNQSKGMGWRNIFSRISMLNGNIKLESELEKGTVVFINLKLKK